jgi:hypothetical protein
MLAALIWLPQSGTDANPYGADFVRRSGELSGCYGWGVGRFDVGPCLTAKLENVTADGTGPEIVDEPGHATWLTLGLAARVGWSLRPWVALFLRPSLMFTTSRPAFAIDGVGSLFRVPLASAGVELGCEWIL